MAPTLRPREGGKAKPPRAREAAGEDPANLAAVRKELRAKAEAGGKAEMGDFDALLELLQAAEDDELAMTAGDKIEMIKAVDEDWAKGKNTRSGEVGLYPISYVE